jgi:hypothetical protein
LSRNIPRIFGNRIERSTFARGCMRLAPRALPHASPPQDGFAVANLGHRPRNLIAPDSSAESASQSAGSFSSPKVIARRQLSMNRASSAHAFWCARDPGAPPQANADCCAFGAKHMRSRHELQRVQLAPCLLSSYESYKSGSRPRRGTTSRARPGSRGRRRSRR